MRRRVLTLLLALAALLAAASPAAADTVINFDDLAAGTQVKNQYQNQGLRLSRNEAGDANQTLTVTAGKTLAIDHSGSCSPGSEFPCGVDDWALDGRVDFSRQFLRLTVVDVGTGPVTLEARNSLGAVIDTATNAGSAPFTLQVDSPSRSIAFFRLRGAEAIDDITYDNPGNPPPPDFSIVPQYNQSQSAQNVPVTVGNSVTIPILLNRFNLSSGPIKFTGSVTSGFVNEATIDPLPQAFNGPDGSVVNLKVTVDEDAFEGSNDITVTAEPQSIAAGSAPRSFTFKLRKIRNYDLHVNGIEVTQGVQGCGLTCGGAITLPRPPLANPAQPVKYSGVPLVAGKTTVARVYAGQADFLASPVKDVDMELHGFDSQGKPLPKSPLSPYNGRKTLKAGFPFVGYDDRADPDGAYNFALPSEWIKQRAIRLRARVVPPVTLGGVPTECGGAECAANNTLEMTDVVFTSTGYITVTPVRLVDITDPASFDDPDGPDSALFQARNVVPLRDGGFYYPFGSYKGIVLVTPPKTIPDLPKEPDGSTPPAQAGIDALNKGIIKANDSDMADALEDWNDDNLRGDLLIGVFKIQGYGLSRGKITEGENPIAVARHGAPFKSVAHELFHGLGRVHASPGCGGNDNGEVGENWPPDQQGEIQATGFDVRTNTPVADPANRGRFKDFMSYCASDANSWISAKGWATSFFHIHAFNLLGGRLSLQARPAAAPAGPVLRVRGRVDITTGAAAVQSVTPRSRGLAQPASSTHQVVAKGAAGNVVATVPMHVTTSHVDGEAPTLALRADVPAAGVARVEIVAVSSGQVIAARAQSANAPRVRIVSPRRGTTVGLAKLTTVRFRATDADRDPLRIKVDYSMDNGRSWRVISVAPDAGRVVLPSILFAGSRRARVRVRANDGFRETSAVSGRFRALGRPPQVQIIQPRRGLRVFNDAFLYLAGQAYEDTFREITRRGRLTWMDGRRVIGRGRSISVSGLRPGRRTLRLVARDRLGRNGSKGVRVRIVAARPRFLRLTAPARLSPRARFVTLRAASTLPGTVRVGGRRFSVGRGARNLRIPVARGRRALVLRLRLSAFGRSSTRLVRIPRS